MNSEICKSILDHRAQLVPALFTERQVDLVQKYSQHQKFTPSEQAYFYSAIRRKMEALSSLREEYYVTGTEMLPRRVEQAKQILKKLGHEKAFISGSFLFRKKYRDIDVYILSRRKKSYHKGRKHLIFITEKMLADPIFLSSLKYSLANFTPPIIKPTSKKPPFEHINLTYQMCINEILNKEEERTLREIVFMYYNIIKQTILDSRSLYLITQGIVKKSKNKRIEDINQMIKAIILKLYSKKYMYQHLTKFVKQLKEDCSKELYNNLPIFIKLYSEVKNECRRTAGQA